MTTKERIVEEALTLFSVKGYKGTSVKDIAGAVGIKDSSIYKHFTGKQEIPDEQEAAKYYGELSLQQLQELSRKVFLFYLQDEFASRFWRLAIMEQFRNAEFYEKYRRIFMEESIAYLTGIFTEMVRQKSFRETDPEVLAMNFYAPIFFLLSKYSGRPEKGQEALEILDKQVAEFHRCYSQQ